MNSYDMFVPTRTLFGSGMLNKLHEQPMPGKKAMIVISNGKSTRANGYLARVESELKQAGIATCVFDGIGANPLKDDVMKGAAAVRAAGCDFIVALGGGSVMDASKAIAGMATNDGDLWDYIAFGTGGRKTQPNDCLPIVAITTTAGTGSETDSGAVITNPVTNEKTAYFHPSSFPRLAIVDPELTLSVPPNYTAFQGFDALFHSTEAFISKFANPMSDMYALNAIENVGRYLARAVQNGKDLEAREHVSWGNTLSGTSMCVGDCTSEHSLEHAMSAYHQALPHGAGLIMISKAYYSFFIAKHVCDDRFIRMAKAMGKEDATKPEDFIAALVNLQKACGVDELKMSDYGITPDEFPKFAKNAKDAMGLLFPCDRHALSDEECVEIYRQSFK